MGQQEGMDSSQGADMENYTSIIAVTNMFVFASVNASTPTSDTKSIVTSTHTPANLTITKSAAHTLMTNMFTNTLMSSSIHTSSIKSITSHICTKILIIT